MRRGLLAILVGIALAGCDSPAPAGPVVVYLNAEQETRLAATFSKFSAETDIPVTLVVAESDASTDKVIDNRGSPPADVLFTSGAADIWRAADRGALRPLGSTALQAVPAMLKDPDGLWSAVTVREIVIAAANDTDAALVGGYQDLANSEFRGRICLSSVMQPANRSLIGMLIEDIGAKRAERVVRAWIRNLAAPPFATEAGLLAALRSGICDYAIHSDGAEAVGLSRIRPNPTYIDIDGIGVARHAVHPDEAQTFVGWMLIENSLPELLASNGKNVGLAAWRDEDVTLLAERVAYQ
jgi:iron(III) transport system substrate-binding protein